MTVTAPSGRRILLVGCAVLAAACDLCRNEFVADVPFPSGRNHAVVFQRDCGATTSYSVQVSVLSSGKKLANEGGNALIADAGHRDVPLQVRATWDSDRVLRLSYDPRFCERS
ncbi:MAG TPA: hypothetical protein VFR85_14450 [Anaeromyxobacteraceae bacterium]|nr:hypothetical protein [Anaeromyxobacteraceae bacterium]